MSATIAKNDLSFFIFGSGHDYTLANSGDGKGSKLFSHPYVPLNSVNYAGQYYFEVPDEHGEMFDAVKDDIAHCTFEPAIGTAFDTEGEVTVKVHYYREYIYDETTLIVEKTVSDKVEVVDHGTISQSGAYADLYSDGYLFWRPYSTTSVGDMQLECVGSPSKSSCIPWRVVALGRSIYNFLGGRNLTDISELAYADTSRCTSFNRVFSGCSNLTDISALANWNVENLQSIYWFLADSGITSLEALAKWNTKSLISLDHAFAGFNGTSLNGLEDWDVSNVTNMAHVFNKQGSNLSDISALANWDVSKVQTLEYAFYGVKMADTDALANWHMPALTNISRTFSHCSRLTDLSGLSNWDSPITNMSFAFESCELLRDISGVSGLNVSSVTDFKYVFDYCQKITSLNGLQGWDVSSGNDFSYMFNGCPWISDISALADWDMSNATNLGRMFYGCDSIIDVDDLADWRLNTTAVGQMLHVTSICYSSKIGKTLLQTAYYFYDYEGRQYVNSEVQDEEQPLTYPTYDASGAENWISSGSSLNAFNDTWTNRPSWN
jgi:hypothetical protein